MFWTVCLIVIGVIVGLIATVVLITLGAYVGANLL